MHSLASSAPSWTDLRRHGAVLFALGVVLQLALPSLHALARDAGASHAAIAAQGGTDVAAVGAGADAPAHDDESCPQCQSFAQARGQTIPARTVSPAPAPAGACEVSLLLECRLPPAPDSACGRPRAPPFLVS